MVGRMLGKVALVTGSAQGIGKAIAWKFIEEGAKVILTDTKHAEGKAIAASMGKHARFWRHDVVSATGWSQVVNEGEQQFGLINVLVNNAGIIVVGSLESHSEEDYRHVVDVNQVGVFLGMKAVVPSMRRAGKGSIINISSVSGLRGAAHTWSYTASKFAVRGMTKVAAIELAPFNIRANSIHPGPFDTPMAASVAAEVSVATAGSPAVRHGDPVEIANLAVLLSSDELDFATGSEFVVDGGLTA